MIDYDFLTLNDREFENLGIDLISIDLDKRFERFKSGKDGGIDGRYKKEIVQAKHYKKSGFSNLMSSLSKMNNGVNEFTKVQRLNPSKYYFITSVGLSAANKTKILKFFHPYIKDDRDIYGQEDLNSILSNNSKIEKKYYKLWLSSTNVLETILNNAIEGRSEYYLEDIREKIKYYIITKNHDEALEKLEETNVLIITGEPGIGKTTLARYVSLYLVQEGYKFFRIESSISEAENIYKRNEKQIFYFDDFLGSTYINAIENNKDTHIVQFINRIRKDKSKKFILTSRTNLFNQGLSLSDTLSNNNIDSNELLIKVSALSEHDKAYLLYNHIWYSNLNEEYIDQIYIDKRYREIIDHRNFSPRLIEFITDIEKINKNNISPEDFWAYILNKLDNPSDIWEQTFDKQSDDFMRCLVLLVVLNGNRIDEIPFSKSYNNLIEISNIKNTTYSSKEFISVIKELMKYFFNRNAYYGIYSYTLFNPSLADFIINRYK
ncbi:MAG: hypothetical protein HRT40_09115, partial [Campylobacteraceae bacterium]|nr:hypothetical protein [Campylobacteraceae bacterium]